MYAIAKSGGKQFRIQPKAFVRVPTLDKKVGEKVRLEDILLFSDGSTVEVGRPLVDGAYAEATVVRHGRTRKILMIKYKRRKNYRRTIGHRQGFTELEIQEIVIGKNKDEAPRATKAEMTEEPAAEAVLETAAAVVAEEKKTEAVLEKKAAKKPAAKEKPAADKAKAAPARKTAAKNKPAGEKKVEVKPAAKKTAAKMPAKKESKPATTKKTASAKPTAKKKPSADEKTGE